MLAPSTLAVPRGRSHQPEQHRNRRRLTGAIRADEPGDDPGGDLEAQAVDRQSAACDRVGAETSVRRFPRFDAHFLTRYLWFHARARVPDRRHFGKSVWLDAQGAQPAAAAADRVLLRVPPLAAKAAWSSSLAAPVPPLHRHRQLISVDASA
jgi:hypothetical protein